MLEILRLGFPRLRNADGTFDSMCIKCFASVARSKQEADLEGMEDAHVCRPGALREFQPSDE
jgi:hypothetical protein